MSVGTSTSTLAVTLTSRTMRVTGGPVWFRNLVTLTASGFGSHNANNLILLVYRGGTLVAYSDDFSGPNTGATGTLDTNTSEMEDVFDGVTEGATREFDVFLYDSDPSSLELLASGVLKVRATRDYAASTPVPPISGTTYFFGSFAFYQGKTYIRSSTDGLYYEFAAYGTGSQVTESLQTTGITIPGSP